MTLKHSLQTLAGICLLSFSSVLSATPVNVNLASSYEIADSLHVEQRLAERISIHCQYVTCRNAKDLLDITGVNKIMLKQIEKDLIFTIMDRGTGYSDDC